VIPGPLALINLLANGKWRSSKRGTAEAVIADPINSRALQLLNRSFATKVCLTNLARVLRRKKKQILVFQAGTRLVREKYLIQFALRT